jgi:hypothetical protein
MNIVYGVDTLVGCCWIEEASVVVDVETRIDYYLDYFHFEQSSSSDHSSNLALVAVVDGYCSCS